MPDNGGLTPSRTEKKRRKSEAEKEQKKAEKDSHMGMAKTTKDVPSTVRRETAFLNSRRPEQSAAALARAFTKAVAKAARLGSKGLELSRNDRRVILYSQFLAELGPVDHAAEVLQALAEQQPNLETALDEHALCNPADHGKDAGRLSDPGFVQRLLFE